MKTLTEAKEYIAQKRAREIPHFDLDGVYIGPRTREGFKRAMADEEKLVEYILGARKRPALDKDKWAADFRPLSVRSLRIAGK